MRRRRPSEKSFARDANSSAKSARAAGRWGRIARKAHVGRGLFVEYGECEL